LWRGHPVLLAMPRKSQMPDNNITIKRVKALTIKRHSFDPTRMQGHRAIVSQKSAPLHFRAAFSRAILPQ
jgi:hypothetical protein